MKSLTERRRDISFRTVENPSALSPVEADVVEFFVSIAEALALPRSIGEVYGLLFVTSKPLTAEDVVHRLNISKGSASQGLKTLRAANAVNSVYMPGDRRAHFVAEVELLNLVQGFLRERIGPTLVYGAKRLEQLDRTVAGLSESQRRDISGRIEKLNSWRKKAGAIFPAIIAAVEA